MTKDEALKLALEALEKDPAPLNAINNAKCFLYSALEQPERKWVGLTDEEIVELFGKYHDKPFSLILAIHNKIKEKNK